MVSAIGTTVVVLGGEHGANDEVWDLVEKMLEGKSLCKRVNVR